MDGDIYSMVQLMGFDFVTMGSCQVGWNDWNDLPRAGNLLIGFPSESLVFCLKMSNSLMIAHFL